MQERVRESVYECMRERVCKIECVCVREREVWARVRNTGMRDTYREKVCKCEIERL